jgi:hypothetical protein
VNEHLPTFGPFEVQGGVDELEPAVAVVRVAFALTRTQLVTALGVSFAGLGADRTPESLTDDEVRREVEGHLAAEAIIELDHQMERDEQRGFTPEQQRAIDVLAAAVDRAFAPSAEPLPVQEPRYGDGTVTLQTLDRGELTIPEPTWCTGHDGEPVGTMAEISHDGPHITATVESEDLGPVPLLRANITHAPFLEIRPEPHPVAYVEGIEAASFDARRLRMAAAQLDVFAGRLRDTAAELDALADGGSP